jgi:hypothetical protein
MATNVSRPQAPASVAHDDAPRVAERPASHGRSATEGGDERAGAKSRYDFVPGSRTGSNGGNVDSLTATRPTETHVPTLATSVRFYRRRCSSRRLEEGFSLHPNSGLTGCLASTPAHRQNEGFATAFSCNFSAEPGSHVRHRTHDAGAGHDANRPFTRLPCVGEFVQSDFGGEWCTASVEADRQYVQV